MTNPVLETIQKRRSVRAYEPAPLTGEQVDALLSAALAAPSANNKEPWRLIAVTNSNLLAEFDRAAMEVCRTTPDLKELYDRLLGRGGTLLYHAPFVLFVATPKDAPSGMDAGILAENVCLAAASMGLGSVILGLPRIVFDSPAGPDWEKKLSFPEGYGFSVAVAVGTAAPSAAARDFKPDWDKVKNLS